MHRVPVPGEAVLVIVIDIQPGQPITSYDYEPG